MATFGVKVIARFKVQSQGKTYGCTVGTSKPDPAKPTRFVGACPELAMEVGHGDNESLTYDEAVAKITERVQGHRAREWTPHYVIKLRGRKIVKPIPTLPTSWWGETMLETSLSLAMVHLAVNDGIKLHSQGFCKKEFEGWPKEGEADKQGCTCPPGQEGSREVEFLKLLPANGESVKFIKSLVQLGPLGYDALKKKLKACKLKPKVPVKRAPRGAYRRRKSEGTRAQAKAALS
jgi:hypothetical protein